MKNKLSLYKISLFIFLFCCISKAQLCNSTFVLSRSSNFDSTLSSYEVKKPIGSLIAGSALCLVGFPAAILNYVNLSLSSGKYSENSIKATSFAIFTGLETAGIILLVISKKKFKEYRTFQSTKISYVNETVYIETIFNF